MRGPINYSGDCATSPTPTGLKPESSRQGGGVGIGVNQLSRSTPFGSRAETGDVGVEQGALHRSEVLVAARCLERASRGPQVAEEHGWAPADP
jgi:hypothetical protein